MVGDGQTRGHGDLVALAVLAARRNIYSGNQNNAFDELKNILLSGQDPVTGKTRYRFSSHSAS